MRQPSPYGDDRKNYLTDQERVLGPDAPPPRPSVATSIPDLSSANLTGQQAVTAAPDGTRR